MKDISVTTLGTTTFWTTTGVEIPYTQLVEEWKAAGLIEDYLPDPPRPAKALRRAVCAQQEKRRLPRRLKKGGNWALVDEEPVGEDDLRHEVVATAKLVGGKGEDKQLEVRGNGLAHKVEDAYHHHLGTFNSDDMSSLLVKTVTRLNGLTLRESGGIYFIHRAYEVEWSTVARLAEKLFPGMEVSRMQPIVDEGGIDSVVSGLTAEVQKQVQHITKQVAATCEDTEGKDAIGIRAIASRQDFLRGLLTKVRSYEELLGRLMPNLEESIVGARAGLQQAEAAVQLAKDKAEAAKQTQA